MWADTADQDVVKWLIESAVSVAVTFALVPFLAAAAQFGASDPFGCWDAPWCVAWTRTGLGFSNPVGWLPRIATLVSSLAAALALFLMALESRRPRQVQLRYGVFVALALQTLSVGLRFAPVEPVLIEAAMFGLWVGTLAFLVRCRADWWQGSNTLGDLPARRPGSNHLATVGARLAPLGVVPVAALLAARARGSWACELGAAECGIAVSAWGWTVLGALAALMWVSGVAVLGPHRRRSSAWYALGVTWVAALVIATRVSELWPVGYAGWLGWFLWLPLVDSSVPAVRTIARKDVEHA